MDVGELTMTLLFQRNLGQAWGVNTAPPPSTARRGPHARGRARLQGRRLWWLPILLLLRWI